MLAWHDAAPLLACKLHSNLPSYVVKGMIPPDEKLPPALPPSVAAKNLAAAAAAASAASGGSGAVSAPVPLHV